MKHEVIDSRVSKRERVLRAAELEVDGARRHVSILNISETGAKLDAEDPPAKDSRCVLHREGIAAPGHVAWVVEHRFGVQFDAPIDRADIARHAAPIWRDAR